MSVEASLLEEIGARISGERNKKSFELLYKAIEKPDVNEFHRKCDAKGPTVTIIYGKFNTIFGGYTSKNWSSNKNRKMKDENAFLFTKSDNDGAKCIFLPIKKDKVDMAITCDANFGPTFGGGKFATFDLQAFKKDTKPESSENKDKEMHLNGTLNVNCAYSVEDDQQKIKTKDINSGQMVVKSVEVYQVVDDELKVKWLQRLEEEDFKRKKRTLMEMATLPGLNIKRYNILLVGVIGSGKSSLVNTLSTVFSEKVRQIAPARDSGTSVTSKVKDYILKSKNGESLQIRIFDIRGFEDERGYDHELELLLDGKLPVGYQFPDKPVPVPVKLETKPTLDEEMHLVCFVNGDSDFVGTDELHKRINDIKKTISKKGLPMVIVATKFDKLCPKIAQNVDHIYASPKAKSAASRIAEFYGVPSSHVFPVVNYVSEKETNDVIDNLALKALYEMYEVIEASLEQHQDMVNKPDDWAEREQLLPLKNAKKNEKVVTLMKIYGKLTELGNKKLLILVVGSTNSGKSSFIDSVSSALQDHIDIKAVGARVASAQLDDVSSTEKFQLYPMKCKHESGTLTKTSIYFGDTPGFQETEGIPVDHVRFILRGNVPDKYKIINGIEETATDFKADPTPGDRMHCVCCVFDCETVTKGLSENIRSTMKNVLRIVDAEDIPYIVILTKCDTVSKAVRENKRKVFEDKKVRECKNKLVEMFGFKQKQIFPVVNYDEENNVDLQNDALLIAAFNEVLKIGKDKLAEIEDEVEGRYSEAL